MSLWGLATGSSAWQTQLAIPVSGLTRRGSPEGLLCPKWRDELESGATPGGGGNDRECPNFGKAVIPPELSSPSDDCCNSLLTSSKKLAGFRPAQAPLNVENQWCLSRRPSFLNERQVSFGRHDWITYGCRCGKRGLSESAGRRVRGWDSLQGHSVDQIASWNSAAVESSTKVPLYPSIVRSNSPNFCGSVIAGKCTVFFFGARALLRPAAGFRLQCTAAMAKAKI